MADSKLVRECKNVHTFPFLSYALFGDLLGKGAFGTVYKAVAGSPESWRLRVNNNEEILYQEIWDERSGTYKESWCTRKRVLRKRVSAAKVVDYKDERNVRKVLTEMSILASLTHKHIVAFYDNDHGAVEGNPVLLIVTEFVEHGDLQKLLQARHRVVPSEQVGVMVARQLLSAVEYIHGLGIIHRDIKPGNVLVLRLRLDENNLPTPEHLLLSDFGEAKRLDTREVSVEQSGYCSSRAETLRLASSGRLLHGTPHFIAPEVWQPQERANEKARDVWSLGVTNFFVNALKFPGNFDAPEYAAFCSEADLDREVDYSVRNSRFLQRLIRGQLRKEVDQRSTVTASIKMIDDAFGSSSRSSSSSGSTLVADELCARQLQEEYDYADAKRLGQAIERRRMELIHEKKNEKVLKAIEKRGLKVAKVCLKVGRAADNLLRTFGKRRR